jgi:hypothetical protein
MVARSQGVGLRVLFVCIWFILSYKVEERKGKKEKGRRLCVASAFIPEAHDAPVQR